MGLRPGEGYMLVTVDAPSLSKAQDLAMEMLTERIIESVATNVSTSTVSEISHTSSGGEISEQETFNRSARLRSANLPFLKGISHTKIQGVYWAKVRDENSKREWIEYSIRYPFSKADLRELTDQFDALESDSDQKLTRLENDIDRIESVDQIKEAITQLEALESYFFDDVRLKKATGLKSRYRGLYKNLVINVTDRPNGVYHVNAVINGRAVRLTTAPRPSSECASQIKVTPAGDGFDITCNTDDCLPEEDNYIDLLLRIDGNKYTARIQLKVE